MVDYYDGALLKHLIKVSNSSRRTNERKFKSVSTAFHSVLF